MFLWKAQDSYLLQTASMERVTSVPRTLSFPCHTSWWLQQLVRHNTLVLHCGCSWVLSYMCLQMHDSASFWCHPDTSCTVLVCCPLKITIFGRHILRMYQSSWSFLLTSVSIGSLVHTFPLCIPPTEHNHFWCSPPTEHNQLSPYFISKGHQSWYGDLSGGPYPCHTRWKPYKLWGA